MEALARAVASNGIVLVALVIAVVIIAAAAAVIYILAFLQGREVSFYPPKIGTRPGQVQGSPEIVPRSSESIVPSPLFSFVAAKDLERSKPLEEIIETSMDLMFGGVALGQAVQRHMAQLERRLLAGAHLRFLLLDPNCPDVARIAATFEVTSNQVRDDIQISLRDTEWLRKKAATFGKGSVEVRLFEREPVFSFVMSDPKLSSGSLRAAIRVYGHRSTTRPNFELKPPNPWFYYFVEVCESIWPAAELWKGPIQLPKPILEKAGVVPYRVLPATGQIEVLLISSRSNPPNWIFPVGEQDKGESLTETARRECEEESGYAVDINSRLGLLEFERGNCLSRMTFFLGIVKAEVTRRETDRQRRWVKLDEVAAVVADDFKTIALAATAGLGTSTATASGRTE